MFDTLKNATRDEKSRFIAAVLKSGEAQDAVRAGDSATGIALYREAIAICPPCEMQGDCRVLLGEHLFDLGDAAAAETVLRDALSGPLSYPYEAFRRLAFACAAQGKFDEAIPALAHAIEHGEDFAFATQAAATYMVAGGHIAYALEAVAPQPELAGTESEYHRRLLVVRAELARLAGDDVALHAALDAAAELPVQHGGGGDSDVGNAGTGGNGTGAGGAMDGAVALWVAVLDRVTGRADVRPEIRAAFEEAPAEWPSRIWELFNDRRTPADLMSVLEEESWTRRAEILSQYRRFAGLLAEHRGDRDDARRHYAAARAEPFTQWCLDYHLAGIALARMTAT